MRIEYDLNNFNEGKIREYDLRTIYSRTYHIAEYSNMNKTMAGRTSYQNGDQY